MDEHTHPNLVVPLLNNSGDQHHGDDDGKEQVLHERSLGSARKGHHVRQHPWIVAWQQDICSFQIHGFPGSHGHANIGDGKGCGVIETVPYHHRNVGCRTVLDPCHLLLRT